MLIRDHNRLEDVPELLKVLPQGIALGLPSQAPNKDLGVGGVPKRGIQELERLGTRAWARNWLILHEQLSITVGGKKKTTNTRWRKERAQMSSLYRGGILCGKGEKLRRSGDAETKWTQTRIHFFFIPKDPRKLSAGCSGNPFEIRTEQQVED